MQVELFIDSVILPAREKQVADDARGHHTYVSFRWYIGSSSAGGAEVFRFSKGAKPEAFESYVKSKGFSDIVGPFKTRKAAQMKTDPEKSESA